MRRRIKGLSLVLTGVLLLFTAAILYLRNTREDVRAGEMAAHRLEELETSIQKEKEVIFESADNTEKTPESVAAPEQQVEDTLFCGKLSLPSLELELPIFQELSEEALKEAPCRYAGSAESGDLVIAGHNYKSHFGKLDNLQAGDQILFQSISGEEYRYQVAEKTDLDGNATEEMVADEWDLTLFTCTMDGTKRITIRCMMMDHISASSLMSSMYSFGSIARGRN